MITETQIQQVIGTTAVDADGDKIGKISEVYLDDETGRPEWATVHTGLFGTKETFVPLAQADLSGDTLRFPYDKAKVKDALKVDTDGHLSPRSEEHTSELQSRQYLVCRLLLEKKKDYPDVTRIY